jgi:hypothetical protein
VPTEGVGVVAEEHTRPDGAGAGEMPVKTVEKPLQLALFVDNVTGFVYDELTI